MSTINLNTELIYKNVVVFVSMFVTLPCKIPLDRLSLFGIQYYKNEAVTYGLILF